MGVAFNDKRVVCTAPRAICFGFSRGDTKVTTLPNCVKGDRLSIIACRAQIKGSDFVIGYGLTR